MPAINEKKCNEMINIAKFFGIKWHSDYIIKKEIIIWKCRLKISWRSSKSVMGRFGGGWNWKIGLQWGKTTLLISLLILEIGIYKQQKGES